MTYLKNIIVRADGNKEIGFGHVYRTIALAQIFSNASVTFISKDADVQNILPSDFTFKLIQGEEIEFISDNFSAENDAIILDGYNYDQDYQKSLTEIGFDLVFIDDILAFEMQASLVLNPSLGISSADYQGENIRFGLGPRFACLRNEFLSVSKQPLVSIPTGFKKIFLSFGGSDFYHISEKLINILHQFNVDEIHLLKGKSFDAERLVDDAKVHYHEHLSAAEMIELIQSVDLCINSASTVSYEIASVKKPMIVGWYADNQKNLYEGLLDNELAIGIGNLVEAEDEHIREKLDLVVRSDFNDQLHAQSSLFDGLNNERLTSLILPLVSRLSVRSVLESDMMTLFSWANDAEVRSNSRSPEPIELEGHQKWFEKRLNSEGTKIFIAKDGQTEIGQIRFDQQENGKFEIDYSIIPAYRGKGLGKHLVALGIDKMRREDASCKIIAAVKAENVPSLKVFQSLGFEEIGFSESDNMHIFEYFTAS